jgi:pyruvate/2-oxoglutarate dehydrogenase complex dihydrolipoamide acyltransferase (E2) component
MIRDIIIPQVGETVEEEVVILKWRKKPGDRVKKGEILMDIETGKGALDLESPYDGTIVEIFLDEGQVATPLTVAAHIECE